MFSVPFLLKLTASRVILKYNTTHNTAHYVSSAVITLLIEGILKRKEPNGVAEKYLRHSLWQLPSSLPVQTLICKATLRAQKNTRGVLFDVFADTSGVFKNLIYTCHLTFFLSLVSV